MTPTFSVIIPTIGRPALSKAIGSILTQVGDHDEVILVGADTSFVREEAALIGARVCPHPPAGDYGYTERAYGIAQAVCSHLVFLDDDDEYVPGAFAAMRAEIAQDPDRPILFKMLAPWGEVLWRDEGVIIEGDFGGAQFVCPNNKARLGKFSTRYEADYDFIVSTLERYPEGGNVLRWSETLTYRCAAGLGRDGVVWQERA